MKQVILFVVILTIVGTGYAQKIKLYRSTGGNQVFYLSSIDSIKILLFECGNSLIYAGKTYHSVLIGTQCWLKENLDIGDMIDGGSNPSNNSIIEKYCYNNDTGNCTTYGGLYQWNEAMQYITTPGAQGICPDGWHLPTLVEFQTLSTTVGGDGNALKEIGQGTGSGAGTNTSGFSALLAGLRYDPGFFFSLDNSTGIWSSSEDVTNYAKYLSLGWDFPNINLSYLTKDFGLSLRCIKD